MKKTGKPLLVIIGLLFLSYFIFMANFDLLDNRDTSKMLVSFKPENETYKIAIFHIPPGSLSQSNIQVRKIINNSKIEIIAKYDNYNELVGYKLEGNNRLKLILNDTGTYFQHRPDTLIVELRK